MKRLATVFPSHSSIPPAIPPITAPIRTALTTSSATITEPLRLVKRAAVYVNTSYRGRVAAPVRCVSYASYCSRRSFCTLREQVRSRSVHIYRSFHSSTFVSLYILFPLFQFFHPGTQFSLFHPDGRQY